MRLSYARPPLTVIVTVLGLGLTHQELWGQREVPMAHMSEAHRRLSKLGDLRLKTYSIHGLAPLVVLFTEAPVSASEVERRYRHQLTSTLLGSMERLGVSLFSLHPPLQSPDSSNNEIGRDASTTFEVFRGMRAWERPQVIIGFADGAISAARLLLRDSSSAALVALVPSTPGDNATAAQEVLWQEFFRPTDRPRPVLVLESMCNNPSAITQVRYRPGQTVLMLPQYDGWLAKRTSLACPKTPVHSIGMDYELTSILTEWLRLALRFPE